MVDTVRTLAALQTLLADNATGEISPQDLRDMLVSQAVPEWMQYLEHRVSGETSHTDDDFFSTDSSGDYTTQTVSGTAAWTVSRGILSVDADGQTASDAAAFLKPITSASAPMTVETRFSMQGINEASNTVGLCFTDGTATSSNVAWAAVFASDTAAGLRMRAGTLTDTFTDVNNTIQAVNLQWGLGTMYVRVAWTAANTWKSAWSIDGVTWTDYGETTDAKTLTPTHFGFIASTHGGTNNLLINFDYLRVADSDLVG